MANITENLQALVNIKNDMKSALTAKNSTPTGGLNTYAEAIRKILAGSSGKYEMLFPEDVVAVNVRMNDQDITDTTVNAGSVNIDSVSGDLFVRVSEYKSITYMVDSNCSLDNSDNKVPMDGSYRASLSFGYGYELDNITIMMKGVNVTSQVYSNGLIDIPQVDGDIVISITSKLKTYTVTNELNQSVNLNDSNTITHGNTYTAVVKANDHYALTSVKVTMGGEVLIDESFDELDGTEQYTITVPQVTDNLIVEVKSKIVLVVTYDLNNVESSNTQLYFRYGESYLTTLSSNRLYDFTEITAPGATLSDKEVIDETNGYVRRVTLTINELTSDIIIKSSAERVLYHITYDLTNVTLKNMQDTVYEGADFHDFITPDLYFEVKEKKIITETGDVWDFELDHNEIWYNYVKSDFTVYVRAEHIVCNVINNLTGVTTNNEATTVLMGESYSELLSIDYSQYDDMEVSVVVNGEVFNEGNVVNGDIKIPIVLGDVIVTATARTETLSQYNTLQHYTIEDFEKMETNDSIDIIMAAPQIQHGFVYGQENFGNGFKNLVRMQHEIAPISNDAKYMMTLTKKQDTTLVDKYDAVLKPVTVTGTYQNNITKLSSSIPGYDLYGLASDISIAARYNNANIVTGNINITYTGNGFEGKSIYVKAYINLKGNNATTYIDINGRNVDGVTDKTVSSLGDFTEIELTSKTTTAVVTGKGATNMFGSARTCNVYILVPNDCYELEVVGKEEVPYGPAFFNITPKSTRLILDISRFTITSPSHVDSNNLTLGIMTNNNPCLFQLKNDLGLYLNSGELLTLPFYSGEDGVNTVWYFYKPGTAGYSTSTVTITNTLNKVTNSNSANSIIYGNPYIATLNWDSSHTPYKLQITMCGHDITDCAFNYDTKEIYIPSVIGPVTITAICVDASDLQKITYELYDIASLTNKTGISEELSTDSYDMILYGETFTAQPSYEGLTQLSADNFNVTIEPSDYQFMEVAECIVTMNGVEYTDLYKDGTLTIPSVEGDVHIKMKALKVIGYVDDTYYDVDKSSNHVYVEANALSTGVHTARYSQVGETLDNYDNITTFTI